MAAVFPNLPGKAGGGDAGSRYLAESRYLLARALLAGDEEGPGNVEKAAGLLRQASDQGHAAAMAALGRLHLEGLGVPQDKRRAVWLIESAADLGSAEAFCLLGRLAELGELDGASGLDALHLFAKAEALGCPEAAGRLSDLRSKLAARAVGMDAVPDGGAGRDGRDGQSGDPGPAAAQAAALKLEFDAFEKTGDPRPLLARAEALLGSGADRAGTGLHILERLAAAGLPEAIYRQGLHALGRRFGPSNPAKAKGLLVRAAEMGHFGAREELRKLASLASG
jgi:TPR repeat protein